MRISNLSEHIEYLEALREEPIDTVNLNEALLLTLALRAELSEVLEEAESPEECVDLVQALSAARDLRGSLGLEIMTHSRNQKRLVARIDALLETLRSL